MTFLKDSSLTTPIYQQLYEYLRSAILSGQLEQGAQLPSTRALADELGISRNTVLNAYDQLFAEGYLENVQGKGTFVTHTLPESFLFSSKRRKNTDHPPKQRVVRLSQRAETLLNTPTMPGSNQFRRPGQAFQTGAPALDEFPYKLWGQLLARCAQNLYPHTLVYQDNAGYRPLREAIAEHVILARQVHCTPDQVIIVSGSQGALYLSAMVFRNPCQRLGPFQRGSFTICIKRDFTPYAEVIKPLFAFAPRACVQRMHIDTISTAIDL